MKIKFFFNLFVCTFLGLNLVAQAPITTGHFEYELTKLETDNPQLSQIFTGAKVTVDAEEQLYRSLTSMMGEQINIEMFNNTKESANFIYLNLMGQKISTQVPVDEFEKKWQNENENSIITYNQEDNKEIAGFKCYAAKIETLKDDGSVSEMNIYLTEAIQIPNHLASNMPEKLTGFPLEYTMIQDGSVITFTLSSYSPAASEKLTEPRTDYKDMPYDQFKNSIGKQLGL